MVSEPILLYVKKHKTSVDEVKILVVIKTRKALYKYKPFK